MTPTETDPRDELLLDALAEGLSYSKAAEVAGCSKATVQRRMRDDGFRVQVQAARVLRAEEAASLVEGLALRAAERVSALVDAESELVALKAALAVLDRAEQRRQARETGDRLGRLERAVEQLLEQRGLRSAACPWRVSSTGWSISRGTCGDGDAAGAAAGDGRR